MEVDAFLADSAAGAEGKLYVLGAGWNGILAQDFPARHDRIGLAIIVRVPYTATNQTHRLTIRLQDADGLVLPLADAPPGVESDDGKVHQIDGEFNVGRPPLLPPGEEQTIPIAMNIDGIVFPYPGSYSFVMEIDGEEVKRLRLMISQA